MRHAFSMTFVAVALTGCVLDEDPAGGGARIVAAGLSFGECGGYCAADLAVDGATVTLTERSWTTGEPDVIQRGALTELGAADLRALARDLATGEPLAETYGDPDLADAGAAYLDLRIGDVVSRTTWQYVRPAPEVSTAHAILIEDVARSLRTCTSSARVAVIDCTPTR